MSRRTVVLVLCLGLTLVAPVGCSAFDRRPVSEEKRLPAPASAPPTAPEQGGPPAVKTSGAGSSAGTELERGGMIAGAGGGEIEQVKAEGKAPGLPPLTKDEGPALGSAKVSEKDPRPDLHPTAKGPVEAKMPVEGKMPGAAKGPGEAGTPTPSPGPPPDPRMRPAPTAYGSVLQLAPGESPIERALELTRRLEELHIQKKVLAVRLAALEEAIQERDKQIATGARQVREATEEVSRARKDLQGWADELRDKQAQLRQQEKENQDLLKLIISTLEKMAAPEPGPRPTDKGP